MTDASTARAKILRFTKANEPDDGVNIPIDPETGRIVMDAEAHMSGLLDDFAQGLAQQLRERGDEALAAARTAGARTTSDPRFDKAAAHYVDADLIDPAVIR